MVWVKARGTWPLPRDAFAFRGAGLQDTYVVPSRDLVVVRMGHMAGWQAATPDLDRALSLLMQAIPEKGSRADARSEASAQTSLLIVDSTHVVGPLAREPMVIEHPSGTLFVAG